MSVEPGTPLPWRFDADGGSIVTDEDEPWYIAEMISGVGHTDDSNAEEAANAAYIVLACNGYPSLRSRVAQLEAALRNIAEACEVEAIPGGFRPALRLIAEKARSVLLSTDGATDGATDGGSPSRPRDTR